MPTQPQEPSTRSPSPSPRLCVPRKHVASAAAVGDLSTQAAAFASLIGYDLTPWQVSLLRDWSAVDGAGKWVHRRCGASVPRQAGKSVSAVVWAGMLAAVMGYSVLWTDHNYSTTVEMLGRFRKIFGKRPGDPDAPRAFNAMVKNFSSKTAQERFELTNGGCICFSTRTDSASLGFSFDLIVYDEAQLLTASQMQTLQPTISHAPHKNSQVVMVGTPTRAGCAADGFKALRAEAWGDETPSDLCWVEYGVDEVGDPLDESRWPLANPALADGSVDAADIRTGIRCMAGDPLGMAQEYLGYWVPAAQQGEPPLLADGEWDACLVPQAPAPTEGERVAYGVRFSTDGRTAALAAACRPPGGGPTHVELVACVDPVLDVNWLADWLSSRAGTACAVAVDGKAGVGRLYDLLETFHVPRNYVIRATTDQAVTAAALTVEGVRNRTVTHIECPALDESARNSPRRPIGKTGAWGWGGDAAAPVEAVGLALLAITTSKRDPSRRQVVW